MFSIQFFKPIGYSNPWQSFLSLEAPFSCEVEYNRERCVKGIGKQNNNFEAQKSEIGIESRIISQTKVRTDRNGSFKFK